MAETKQQSNTYCGCKEYIAVHRKKLAFAPVVLSLATLTGIVACDSGANSSSTPTTVPAASVATATTAPSGAPTSVAVNPQSCLPVPAPTAVPTPSVAPTATVAPANPAPTAVPTKSDGIYTPTTNREIYIKIASDHQEIVSLTGQVINEGKPLPAGDILKIYEEAKIAKVGTGTRPMRGFALDPARTRELPDAVAFYCSHTFLDDPVIAAIVGTGPAASYTPLQRVYAIQQGLLRTISVWSRHYIERGAKDLNPKLADEGWAVYVGEEKDGKYPTGLAGHSVKLEQYFSRPGTLDTPIRQAMYRLHQAGAAKDQAAADAARDEVYAKFNSIFYLGAVRGMNESLKSAQGGFTNPAAAYQVEGYYSYMAIQPWVAKAEAAADRTIMAYFTAAPSTLTAQKRDEAIAALNRTASALRLPAGDVVDPATLK